MGTRIAAAALLAACLLSGCSSHPQLIGEPDGATGSGSDSGRDSGPGSTYDAGPRDAGVSVDAGLPGWLFGGGPPPWSYDGGVCAPVPPQAVVDLSLPPVTRSIALDAGADLQAALDAAQPGDELVLPAGAVFSGNFVLHPRAQTGWVTIRTSNLAGLPPLGSRVDPAQHAAAMVRLETPTSMPVLATAGNADHWRLVGIELGIATGVPLVYDLLELGDATAVTSAALPHDVVVDRCWIHANDTGDARRGIALNGNNIGVVGSNISNFKEVGADSQAVAGWNGAGPFTLYNNYFEGAAETVLFGGSDPVVPNLVPSDIVVVHNTLTKRLTWNANDPSYGGVPYGVKNVFELKNAQRVWAQGNIIERAWVMGQVGYAVLFTPRNQGGTAAWSGIQDVSLTDNIIRHAAGCTSYLSEDYDFPSVSAARIRVWNNLFYDVGTAEWGGGGVKGFQFLSGPDAGSCVAYDHLTADNADDFGSAGDTPLVASQFAFTNSIVNHGTYGFFGSAVGEGTVALTTYFTDWTFSGNVIYGGGSANQYPPLNAFPVDFSSVGFVDAGAGDYHLAPSSPYKGQATDGKDPGADIDEVMAATR